MYGTDSIQRNRIGSTQQSNSVDHEVIALTLILSSRKSSAIRGKFIAMIIVETKIFGIIFIGASFYRERLHIGPIQCTQESVKLPYFLKKYLFS